MMSRLETGYSVRQYNPEGFPGAEVNFVMSSHCVSNTEGGCTVLLSTVNLATRSDN
jgi:hypothetical protein